VVAVRGRPRNPIVVLLPPLLALAACAGPAADRAAETAGQRSPAATAPSTASAPAVAAPTAKVPPAAPSPAAHGGPARPPDFAAEIRPVTAQDLGQSWRPGCPVGPDQLRQVRLDYWGFDGQPHRGTLVVHRTVTADVITVFRTLYAQRFPIRRMTPVDAYGGSDDASMADDNTSAFNCRNAVTGGPATWSAHAYGKAIDVNPVENPYLLDGDVLPPAGRAYLDRGAVRAGMAVPDGALVKAFTAAGWTWGGRWSDPDYQHFSRTGR
jgi:hypothetical protein